MTFDVRGYLSSLSRFGLKPGLERIRGLLHETGDPQDAFVSVHIGGTNGKGSIAATTASIFAAAGYRVGLYTSPHLIRYNERITVGGVEITDEELAALMEEVAAAAERVKAASGSDPTEFEVGTAVAFLYFARRGVDIAVVEVGLGGRLDSTNVLESRAVALGRIGLDHTKILGDDIGAIAREKAGIFRPGRPAVVAPQTAAAAHEIALAAQASGTPVVWVRGESEAGPTPKAAPSSEMALSPKVARSREVAPSPEVALPPEAFPPGESGKSGASLVKPIEWTHAGGRFDLVTPWKEYRALPTPLLGRHQIDNAATAVTLVDALRQDGFAVDERAVREGLLQTRWPGRLELRPGKPRILLDGVHNHDGAVALSHALGTLFQGERIVFLMAILAEKDAAAMLTALLPHGAGVVFTAPTSSRIPPNPPERLKVIAADMGFQAECAPSAHEGLARAITLAGPRGIVCVCGSLYLVGEVMEIFDKGNAACAP